MNPSIICDNLGTNESGHLTFAGVDAVALAKQYKTPSYIMDENKIIENCKVYQNAMKKYFGNESKPLFASKALCFKRIYEIMKEQGMSIDVVSSGELYTATKAGFPMERAYFHGNNKTDEDIAFAMDNKIGYFMCDNKDELEVINREATSRNISQKVILRLTPGIDPHTQAKISTGKVDSKFGAAIETGQAEELVKLAILLPNVDLQGYHCHIGSQIFEYKPFCDAAIIMIEFIAEMKLKHGYEAKVLNLGGGMGVRYTSEDPVIDYEANIKGIAELIKQKCNELSVNMPQILMEPGRSIVANAGMTLYSVGSIKEIPGFKNYVAIDGGMPDNPRYALYESAYSVVLANRINEEENYTCTIAGKCCESGDIIQEAVNLPKPNRNDIIAVFTTGAYNYSMASNYNALTKPPVIMIRDGESYVAVKRESFDDMISCQI